MNKLTILFAVVAALLGVAVINVYRQNSALEREIAANTDECGQRIAKLEDLYRTEIDDLRRYLLEQYNRGPEETALVQAEKPRFNRLVSHGHRTHAINSKYEFLLQSALLDTDGKQKLRRLLFDWERKADAVQTLQEESDPDPDSAEVQKAQTELDDAEAQIRALLQDPMDYDHFIMLRQRNL